MTPRTLGVTIRYWHGYCSEVDLDDIDKDHLRRLLLGEYASLKLEKLGDTSIYSIRVTKKRRILFTTIEQAGMGIALVLKVLRNHDYKNNVENLNNKLIMPSGEVHLDETKFITIDTIENLTPQVFDESAPEFTECDYYNGNFLILTDEQKQVKDVLKMPLVLSGVAGSGKTSTVLSWLIQIVEDYHRNEITPEFPILFVSEKKSLILERRQEWNNHPLSQTPAGQSVLFMTDTEVCDAYFPVAALQWTRLFDEALNKRILKTIHNESLGKFSTTGRMHQLMHEFEIIACSDSKDEYFKLGEHESNVTKEERPLLWASAQTLFKALAKDKCYSPRLHRFKPTPCFDTVFVDEAQGGSRVLKRNLKEMAREGRFVACVDTRQINDKANPTDVAYMLKKLGLNGSPATLHHLTQTFRNPLRVISLASKLAHLRRYVNHGITDKTEQTKLQNAAINSRRLGELEWVNMDALTEFLDRVNTSRIDFAIVTTEANREKAKQTFKTGQVFTADEIGGLEYRNIILSEMTTHEFALLLNRALKNYNPEAGDFLNLPKVAIEDPNILMYLNWLHTGITRCMESLYFIEPYQQNRRLLLEALKEMVAKAKALTVDNPIAPPSAPANSDEAAFEERILSLIQKDLKQQARGIWEINLKRDPANFDAFLARHCPTLEPVISVSPTINTAPSNIKTRPSQITPPTTNTPKFAITQKEIEDKLADPNYLTLWTKVNKHSKTKKSLLIRVLEDEQCIDLLEKAIYTRKNYPERLMRAIIKTCATTDIKQPESKPLPLIFWIYDNNKRAIIMKALYKEVDEDLFLELKNPYKPTVLMEKHYSQTNHCELPLIVLLGFESPLLFRRLLLDHSAQLLGTLAPYWLAPISKNGCSTTATLLTDLSNNVFVDPDYFSSLFEEIDFVLPLDQLVAYQGIPSLVHIDYLLSTEQGSSMLAYFLKASNDPELVSGILTETFFLAKVELIEGYFLTRLSHFSMQEKLSSLLKDYFLNHVEDISEVAFALHEGLDDDVSTIPLYNFTQTVSGINLLKILFTSRSDIMTLIPLSAWTRIWNDSHFDGENNSLLNCLFTDPDGNNLLKELDPAIYPELYAAVLTLTNHAETTQSSSTNTTLDETLSTSELDELENQGAKNIRQLMHRMQQLDPTAVDDMLGSPLATEIFASNTPDDTPIATLILSHEVLLQPFVTYFKAQPDKLPAFFARFDFRKPMTIEGKPVPFFHFMLYLGLSIQLLILLIEQIKQPFFEIDPATYDDELTQLTLSIPAFNTLTPLQFLAIYYPKVAGLVFQYNVRLCLQFPTPFWLNEFHYNNRMIASNIPLALLLHACDKEDILPFMRFACVNNNKILKEFPLTFWFKVFAEPITVKKNTITVVCALDLLMHTRLADNLSTIILNSKSVNKLKWFKKNNPEAIMHLQNNKTIYASFIAKLQERINGSSDLQAQSVFSHPYSDNKTNDVGVGIPKLESAPIGQKVKR